MISTLMQRTTVNHNVLGKEPSSAGTDLDTLLCAYDLRPQVIRIKLSLTLSTSPKLLVPRCKPGWFARISRRRLHAARPRCDVLARRTNSCFEERAAVGKWGVYV